MRSRTTARFRASLAALPPSTRQQTREAYRAWVRNPRHPSLRFKRLNTARPVYSLRISRSYRALGVLDGETMVWFWIGSHADYERLIKRL